MMKRLLVLFLLGFMMVFVYGQDLKKVTNMNGFQAKFRVNAGITEINANSTAVATSAGLAAALSDETGTAGSVVFSASPTFTGVVDAPTIEVDSVSFDNGAEVANTTADTLTVTETVFKVAGKAYVTGDVIAGNEFVIGSAGVEEAELEIIDGATVETTELNQLATVGSTTISAAQWTGLGSATTAGIALWDDAAASDQLVTLGVNASASEINTPLDGASVTLTEFQELETIGETTVSAAQWTGLGAATTAGIALWDDASAADQLATLGAESAATAAAAYEAELNNSAGLLAALDDETGTGLAVFSTSPTFTTGITTAALTATGVTSLDSSVSIGSWGYTGEHVILGESSSNTNANFGNYSMINYAVTASKTFAGAYNRLVAITIDQPNMATMVGTESQFRLRDVDIGNGVHAGLWAYAEQSGTSVLSGGGTFDAISATIESEAGFSCGATEHVTGITVDCSLNGSAGIDADANFSGIYIKSNGLDWKTGIKITGVDSVDIEFQNGAFIYNNDADSLTFVEDNFAFHGSIWLEGAAVSDFVFNEELTPFDEYVAKAKELNHMPAFETYNRKNIGDRMAGNEQSIEELLLYMEAMEARIKELEAKLNE